MRNNIPIPQHAFKIGGINIFADEIQGIAHEGSNRFYVLLRNGAKLTISKEEWQSLRKVQENVPSAYR